jgi:ribosomal RNA-processing protein 9
VDETQLVFQIPKDVDIFRSSDTFPEGSMDCVAVIDEQHFITGGDNGDIILWALNKKKPQFVKRLGHGVDTQLSAAELSAEKEPEEVNIPSQPRWITCLASLPYTDLFFSGSWDGKLGMWKVSEDLRRFELLKCIDLGIKGVINGISVEEMGRRGEGGVRVILAIGAECRLGRWKRVKGGWNCAIIVNFGFHS